MFFSKRIPKFINGLQLKEHVDSFLRSPLIISGINLHQILLNQYCDFLNIPAKFNLKEAVLIIYRIFCCKTIFKGEPNSLEDIWIIKEANSRKVYLKVYESLLSSNEKRFSIITMPEIKPPFLACIKQSKNRIKYFTHIFIHIRSLRKFNVISSLTMTELCIKSIDLFEDFKNYNPKSILSFKDFSGINNAIIQIANLRNIPTFTTQHAVHHCFQDHHFRQGNLIFLNSTAKFILLWGNACFEAYKKYKKYYQILLQSECTHLPLICSPRNNSSPKLLVCLGGARHKKENQILLDWANRWAEKNHHEVYVKLHPSIHNHENKENVGTFDKFNIFEEDSLIGDKTIILTGLSGSYYDYLYLGFKVIYFHFGYPLEYDLPRALKAANTFDEFIQQYNELISMPLDHWYSIALPVVKDCFGLTIKGTRSQNLIDEIVLVLKSTYQ